MTRHKSQDERRAQILEAARKCFVEKGYERCRMEDIAKTAKLSKGGVYFHFKSKREIFATLFEQEFQQSSQFLLETLQTTDNATSKLNDLAAYYIQNFSNNQDQARFNLIVGQMAIKDPEFGIRMREIHEGFLHGIEFLLKAGIEMGEIRPVNTRSTSILLKAMIDGLEVSNAIGVEVQLEEIIFTGIEILSRGLTPQK